MVMHFKIYLNFQLYIFIHKQEKGNHIHKITLASVI